MVARDSFDIRPRYPQDGGDACGAAPWAQGPADAPAHRPRIRGERPELMVEQHTLYAIAVRAQAGKRPGCWFAVSTIDARPD